MLTAKEKSLLSALEPRAASEGVEIVTLEIVGSKKAPTIRVYIDAAGGISFDELARTQAWVGDVMDELDPFPGAYMLEVSSPGIDRPLRTPEHFARFEMCIRDSAITAIDTSANQESLGVGADALKALQQQAIDNQTINIDACLLYTS